jgi:transcriptional regulator with XRE-family HTH domain
MAVGESPAAARRRLRLALRRARESKRLTQREVAEALDWSMSKVNRIEAGDVTVTSTDLQAMLRLFEVTESSEIEDLAAAARAARRRGWWDQPEYREHLTPAMIQSLQFETEAAYIRSFFPNLIPGVLQTRPYASAIVDIWSEELSERERITRVDVRTKRRDQLFNRPDPPVYLLILDESVLLREVGGPRVMSDQLYDLLAMIQSNRVTVRVVPLANVALFATGLFVLYGSDEEDIALYRESHLADEVVYAPDTLRRHRVLFERAWEQCLSPEQSNHAIEARAALLRSTAERSGPAG